LQLAPGFNAAVQAVISDGELSAKSPSCAPLGPEIPLTANVGSAIATWPVFVTWTVNKLLESPTKTEPKLTKAGETPSVGGESPVPLSVVDCAVTPKLVVPTVNVAVVAPTVTGSNVTSTVQDPPAATVVPHVVAPTEKFVNPDPAIEKLGCPRGAPPLLVIVTVLAAKGILICSLPKAIEVGDKLMEGGDKPLPLRLTACARSASEIVSVPDSPEATLGVNSTVIPHDELAANWLPQESIAVKSVLPDELFTDVPMPVRGNPPLLVIVTVIGGALCPSTVAGKAKLVVESVSVGPASPVPLNWAVCVPTPSVTVKLPVAAPACVGTKSTVTAHADPAARELPHVLVTLANGALTTSEVRATVLPPTF
jgi:hypothetical protein